MEYAILGKTGLKISRIGFGGIPIQRIAEETAIDTLLYAFQKGVNFIDTARGYGISETYIGKALKQTDKRIYVATKAPALTKDDMQKAMELSFQSMQTDYIDLYQIHNITTLENLKKAFGSNGSVEALEEAKHQGKIGHIGITSHKMDILFYALEHFADRFESIMYPYNIVERQAADLFRLCAEKNIGVLAMKPLGGGNLNETTLAMKFIMQNPHITAAIPGMANRQEVDEDTRIDNSPLTEQEQATCERLRLELGNDFCRRCGYCAPCTAGIDIPVMFTMYNYLERYHLKDWASQRYFANAKTAKDCIDCGLCETRCPYQLPIRKKLHQVAIAFGEIPKSDK